MYSWDQMGLGVEVAFSLGERHREKTSEHHYQVGAQSLLMGKSRSRMSIVGLTCSHVSFSAHLSCQVSVSSHVVLINLAMMGSWSHPNFRVHLHSGRDGYVSEIRIK